MKLNIFTITLLLTLAPFLITAQSQYEVNKSSGTLKVLSLSDVSIEGYDGNKIVFINVDRDEEENSRAQGLKAYNVGGLEDNSGIGLSVIEDGTSVTVREISNDDCCGCQDEYTIRVPKKMNILMEYTSNGGDDINISNVDGEIELNVTHNDIMLKDVTGPMSVKSVHGDIDVIFSQVSQSNPVTVASVYGYIDITMPSNTKANMNVVMNNGSLYSDLNINVLNKNINRNQNEQDTKKINANLNGGGVAFNLSTRYEDIYIRAK